ncbi:MAG: hypothetical protein AB7G54_07570, partial [Methyloceanibacter sp.]
KWRRGPRYGGGGGSALLKDRTCPRDQFINGISLATNREQHVAFIELGCNSLAGGGGSLIQLRTGADPNRDYSQVYADSICPGGEAATGIHGRAGPHVDALGLICGPKPAVMAAPTPAAPPSPVVADPTAPPADIVKDPYARRANFSGVWNSVAGKDATKFRLDLGQQGTLVKGSYQPNDGRISGRVDGNVLIFNWSQPGMNGTGRFEMLDPENKTFRGEYYIDGQSGLAGYWGGARE